jgi:hypothetical protein
MKKNIVLECALLCTLLTCANAHADATWTPIDSGDGWQTSYDQASNSCMVTMQSGEAFATSTLALISKPNVNDLGIIVNNRGWNIKAGVPLYIYGNYMSGNASPGAIVDHPTSASPSGFSTVMRVPAAEDKFLDDVLSGIIIFREGSETANNFIFPLSNPRGALNSLDNCLSQHSQ